MVLINRLKEECIILTCKLGNEIINCYDGIHDKEQLKKWATKKILICPACGKPYEYCHGKVKTPYFRHMDKNECEDLYSESETEEHINGKRDLYEWIKRQSGVTNAVLEGWIPETKQRPDIMFEHNGQKYVIEYQCTPIATEYVKRHELYKAGGIIDIWIAGYSKYFTENSRHKYLEDYIQGYYNPQDCVFTVGNNTEQGRFLSYVKGKTQFYINGFSFNNGNIIYKTFLNHSFSELLDLRKKRIDKNYKSYLEDLDRDKKRIISIQPWIAKNLNGTFGNGTFYTNQNRTIYYLYGGKKSYFYKKDIYVKKKGFYKRLCDIKNHKSLLGNIDDILSKFNNEYWSFSTFTSPRIGSGNKIRLYVSLLGCFDFSIDIDISIKDDISENQLKEILLPIMKECYKNGQTGNGKIRIMEVRE